MKPLYITACILASLAYTVPVYAANAAQTTEQLEQQELKVYIEPEHSYCFYLKENASLTIDFDTPMIDEATLSGAPTEGYYSIRYAHDGTPINAEAKWLSATKLQLTITEKTAPMRVVQVEVPKGLKDLKGREYDGKSFTGVTTDGINVHYTSSNTEPEVIFLGGRSAQDSALLAERIGSLYFSLGDTTIPAGFRPATAADAVKHWDAYYDAFGNVLEESSKKEVEAMGKLPGDTVLPNTWVSDVPVYPVGNEKLKLNFPESTCRDYTPEEYLSATLYETSGREPHLYMRNETLEQGKHNVFINFHLPAKSGDLNALMQSLSWEVLDYHHNDTYKALKWEDGALRTTIRGKKITINIDEEATRKYLRSYRLNNGSVVEGISCLVLKADLGKENPPVLHLRCHGHYLNIADLTSRKTPGSWTDLTPGVPYIYSDVSNGQMMSHGTTTINCTYGDIRNGKVRLCKLDNSTRNVVKVINAYEAWYTGDTNSYIDLGSGTYTKFKNSNTNRINKMRIIPTELLPGVQQEKSYDFAEAEGELSINLAEQFGTQGAAGLYFVEITGESMRTHDNYAPIVNQGLVQVSDLGLLWKLNGGRIFAWGYHLSDGKDVQQGTLRMLDDQGNTLAEAPLSQGIARADFAKDTKFLQLSTANDSVVIAYNSIHSESNASESWDEERVALLGIPTDELPQALIYTFSDRSLYRPGEVAHLKGMVRWVKNNELSAPEIESITANISVNGKTVTKTVTPDAEGNFSLDVETQRVGYHSVEFDIKYKGDADQTSPDYAALKQFGVDIDDWYVKNNIINSSRKEHLFLQVEEFRRNEFEVTSELSADLENGTADITTTATNFTTTPVAHGEVTWRLQVKRRNFYPLKWQDYYFGDYTNDSWSHFYAYYMGDECAGESAMSNEFKKGVLDAEGKGSVCLALPVVDGYMGRLAISAFSSVTNGNEQTINSGKKLVIDPTEVYVGIKSDEKLMQVGQKMPVELVAVRPDGEVWQGAPLQGLVKVVRTSFKTYRYGSAAASGVQNVKEEEVVWEAPVTFGNTPTKVEIPLEHAGKYTIIAGCTDTKGKSTASAVCNYVWGEKVSPWYYGHNTELELVTDKEMYKPGDTANILVQTPVNAEVMVTVERGKVLRHYKRSITVDNPVVQVPVEAGDSPVVFVGVSMVQSAHDRKENGAPLVKMGACCLNVEAAEKVLSIELNAPQEHLLPTDACVVSGVVRDAAGNPVPNADVTLYAEDEGTLQVVGYSLPTPQLYFHSQAGRHQGVLTYSALGQLYSDNMKRRYMGNKGVFVGGGGEGEGAGAVSDEEAEYLRENFEPCALWLSSIKTNEHGCFTTAYYNPDTLTRYRLMAVAATKDQFGSAKTDYHVTKPIMLEPVAPLGTTEGDLLHMPVTVSMLPEQLAAAANGAEVEWKVSLSGTNVTLPEPEKIVRLKGNQPVTISFPIITPHTGKAELQWHVQASTPTDERMANCKDAVKLSFDVIPPTPFLRERICTTLQNGQSARLHDWIMTQYRADSPVQLTMSTSPIAGLRYHVQYLLQYPYGCSEQLSSAVIPWILQPKLEKVLGMKFETTKKREDVLQDTFSKLDNRYLGNGQYSYWDGNREPSEYSPYVVLVSALAMENDIHAPGLYEYKQYSSYTAMRNTVIPKEKKEQRLGGLLPDNTIAPMPNMLSLYVLARANELPQALFQQAVERMRQHKKITPEQRWMFALCARLINSPMADTLKQEAMEAKEHTGIFSYGITPPLDCIKLMYAIADAPQAAETAEALRKYLDEGVSTYSTWRNAWTTLAVYEYMKANNLENKKASVNGQNITLEQPLMFTQAYGSNDLFAASGDTVYVNGYAEGHTSKTQHVQAIDQGIKVTRRYEKLMPDGSWQPTATFAVGDVVKVHLTAALGRHIDASHLRYLVVEDRLPAAFEAVNPALTSQALPPGVDEKQARSWWYYCSSIDNKEFLKDRVRFFASYISNRTLNATYVARVLRPGKVTAPATKAELMYRPEIRGLSVPQKLEIK